MLTKQVESLSKNYYKVRWNYYKLRQLSLLQSAMDRYYKLRQLFLITKCDTVYYKLRQALQSAMNLLQIAAGITKCDDYYKLRQYLPLSLNIKIILLGLSVEWTWIRVLLLLSEYQDAPRVELI